MSGQHKSNTHHIIAALQLLGDGPAGARNEPVQNALRRLHLAAIEGRSEPAAPLRGVDRPIRDRIDRLQRENRLLIDQVERLACAVGACPNCWGTIPDCEDCGGIGKPGAYNPDHECFTRFVLPVIARLMAGRVDETVVADSLIGLSDPNHPFDTPV